MPPAVEARSPNHRNAREVPGLSAENLLVPNKRVSFAECILPTVAALIRLFPSVDSPPLKEAGITFTQTCPGVVAVGSLPLAVLSGVSGLPACGAPAGLPRPGAGGDRRWRGPVLPAH